MRLELAGHRLGPMYIIESIESDRNMIRNFEIFYYRYVAQDRNNKIKTDYGETECKNDTKMLENSSNQ